MSIRKLPYKTLELLIKKHLTTDEDNDTYELIKLFKRNLKRGYITKDELIIICRWKSPRAMQLIKSNSPKKIEECSKKAFKTRSEMIRLQELTKLTGVSIPMASSILMFKDPKRYGVIDIRVWQVLHNMGNVRVNKKGLNFNFKQWYHYLVLIRYFAKKFSVSARDIERTLFEVHEYYQIGNLYD